MPERRRRGAAFWHSHFGMWRVAHGLRARRVAQHLQAKLRARTRRFNASIICMRYMSCVQFKRVYVRRVQTKTHTIFIVCALYALYAIMFRVVCVSFRSTCRI